MNLCFRVLGFIGYWVGNRPVQHFQDGQAKDYSKEN